MDWEFVPSEKIEMKRARTSSVEAKTPEDYFREADRHYEQAKASVRKGLEIQPNFWLYAAQAAHRAGDMSKKQAALEQWRELKLADADGTSKKAFLEYLEKEYADEDGKYSEYHEKLLKESRDFTEEEYLHALKNYARLSHQLQWEHFPEMLGNRKNATQLRYIEFIQNQRNPKVPREIFEKDAPVVKYKDHILV